MEQRLTLTVEQIAELLKIKGIQIGDGATLHVRKNGTGERLEIRWEVAAK
jgi:hypothetical protein